MSWQTPTWKILKWCVYDINNHIYALWIKNTSESDPCSYEATKAVAKKGQKNVEVTKMTGGHHMKTLNHVVCQWAHSIKIYNNERHTKPINDDK